MFKLTARLPVAFFTCLIVLGACKKTEKATAEAAAATTQANAPANLAAQVAGEVSTVNAPYHRLHSRALVRSIAKATKANLDFAAYSKNVMRIDPESVAVLPTGKVGLSQLKFAGLVEELQPSLDLTPLAAEEKAHPMAWTPVLEHLLEWNFTQSSALANVYASVTSEKWGDSSDVSQSFQEFGSLYVHRNGAATEVWVEIEFKPWMQAHLVGIVDHDGDGFPDAMARLDAKVFTADMVKELLGSYATRVLNEAEVIDWARNLASRWYPSYNTDLVEIRAGNAWPYEDTPLSVLQDLQGLQVANPLFMLRGRPFEDTLFNVFVVAGMGQNQVAVSASVPKANGQSTLSDSANSAPTALKRNLDPKVKEHLQTITSRIDKEKQSLGGGTWDAWRLQVQPFQKEVLAFSKQEAISVQGLLGKKDYLVFRRELDYLLAPDWQAPEASNHPLPVIKAFKDSLAELGIDFLFVPIPTKLDIYPEILTDKNPALPGNIAQPYFRKLQFDLAEAGIETVDLLTPFLKLKAVKKGKNKSLYQRQDTHWTSAGLEAAAQILSERIRAYGWYGNAYATPMTYRQKDSLITSLGDIQARLTDAAKAKVSPEAVLGHRVLDPQGKPYEDDTSAPILILGDSYTGVFQTVGCRNAGVTAHIAAKIGGPVDLIMGWGGGPEAPGKLAKRGDGYLNNKRLVVWMMSARDLFVYPGDWAK